MIVLDCVSESPLWDQRPQIEALAQRALLHAAQQCGHVFMDGAEISLLLVDDAQMRALNHQWRDQDKPTNVLSFQSVPPERLATAPVLGDIILAYETVDREAQDENKTFDDHASHLIVHGFLHLLGHDHMNDQEADIMEALETRILASLGIADPYADEL
jgi:probable rRNA maturation factor